MNLAEAAVLVAHIVAYDNRSNDDLTDRVWQTALNDVELTDALAAIDAHYRESTKWLMPAEVRERVKKLRRDRLAVAGLPDIPSGLDQIQERQWSRAWCRAVGSGLSREEATSMVDQAAGIVRELESPRPVAQLIAGSKIGQAS